MDRATHTRRPAEQEDRAFLGMQECCTGIAAFVPASAVAQLVREPGNIARLQTLCARVAWLHACALFKGIHDISLKVFPFVRRAVLDDVACRPVQVISTRRARKRPHKIVGRFARARKFLD